MTTLPSHVPIPLYRLWVVETVAPRPLLSLSSDLAAPVPGETPTRQRRKLWELASHLYCSIVGTCLNTAELRKVVAKFKGHELKGFSDLAIHEEAVKAAATTMPPQGSCIRRSTGAMRLRSSASIRPRIQKLSASCGRRRCVAVIFRGPIGLS